MERAPLTRLSVMMVLQYAVWGAWLPVAARFLGADREEGGLGFDSVQIGLILGLAGSIGALAAPFIGGQLADRRFRTERCLATLLLLGGIVQVVLWSSRSYPAWLLLSILYSVLYMPTLALSNSLAFAHLDDVTRQFPKVRVWGTIGWILPAWTFPMVWLQTDLAPRLLPPFLAGTEVADVTGRLKDAVLFSGVISLAYAAYCLTLPATPPRRDAREPLAVLRAFRLFRRPSFAVLVAASLPVAVVHNLYFLRGSPYLEWLGVPDSEILPAMSIAQFSEILVIAALGWLLRTLGIRLVLTIGAFAYCARYAIWSMPDLPLGLLVGSQAIHGVCYACFFAAAYIHVDRLAPADARHSAQTVFGMLILGGGPSLAGLLNGLLPHWLPAPDGGDDSIDYALLWRILALTGAATAVFVLAAFRDETETSPTGEDAVAA